MALQRSAGNRAVQRLLPQPEQGVPVKAGVVQRQVTGGNLAYGTAAEYDLTKGLQNLRAFKSTAQAEACGELAHGQGRGGGSVGGAWTWRRTSVCTSKWWMPSSGATWTRPGKG